MPAPLVAGHVSRLVPALVGLTELAPAVGAPVGIGADFGLELQRPDDAADPAGDGLVSEVSSLT